MELGGEEQSVCVRVPTPCNPATILLGSLGSLPIHGIVGLFFLRFIFFVDLLLCSFFFFFRWMLVSVCNRGRRARTLFFELGVFENVLVMQLRLLGWRFGGAKPATLYSSWLASSNPTPPCERWVKLIEKLADVWVLFRAFRLTLPTFRGTRGGPHITSWIILTPYCYHLKQTEKALPPTYCCD